ncbi:hypothetical protein GCM10025868_42210 [Angustibacter aerolatus]|uniref:Uncharacterized protein n=1 Tax=Angustibacter aerolatus TaxID=1162965 RepID=A0ABQ6JQL3_9ACTN|nr:hypothetical protein GCM10025868_42210 [Angustibacter aerolatus]
MGPQHQRRTAVGVELEAGLERPDGRLQTLVAGRAAHRAEQRRGGARDHLGRHRQPRQRHGGAGAEVEPHRLHGQPEAGAGGPGDREPQGRGHRHQATRGGGRRDVDLHLDRADGEPHARVRAGADDAALQDRREVPQPGGARRLGQAAREPADQRGRAVLREVGDREVGDAVVLHEPEQPGQPVRRVGGRQPVGGRLRETEHQPAARTGRAPPAPAARR